MSMPIAGVPFHWMLFAVAAIATVLAVGFLSLRRLRRGRSDPSTGLVALVLGPLLGSSYWVLVVFFVNRAHYSLATRYGFPSDAWEELPAYLVIGLVAGGIVAGLLYLSTAARADDLE